MEWLRYAACVDEDPELFFPVGTTGPALDDIAAAKRVCGRCPVIVECLAWALNSGQTAGVWGGTCEQERVELLRVTRHRQTGRSAG
ncbi:WhiB family transcriptional regulator [Streptomyces yaanensis]|uniref:Transcriptional regulator WhiB n=1 Tax=Streptomyces yaanensis TaxID=1142239 RepID=A0ABV7SEY6_9ACTN|nr:WhiB family transcriptional regulator [Streptomyces sp. CGMCC 4.7035]WNB99292.1 WhiB family transcriptional regulator [Streptomyces sp. CGMCC 4.7035]